MEQVKVVKRNGIEVQESIEMDSDVIGTFGFGTIIDLIDGITDDNEVVMRGKLLNGEGWITVGNNNEFPVLPYNKLPNSVEVTKHPHALKYSTRSITDWNCDGRNFDGGCRSRTDGLHPITEGWLRYRCDSCDFDFCEWCANEYITNPLPKENRVVHVDGANIRETIDLESEIISVKDRMDVIEVVDEQEYEFNNLKYQRGRINHKKNEWTTISISNGGIVLLPYYPLPKTINAINHSHPLQLSSNEYSWNCDGRNIGTGCMSGTDGSVTEGWVRYRCDPCDFDYCEWCAYAYTRSSCKK